MVCPLIPCSRVVADSGKILFEPGKTVCFTLKHNELPILPRGHEMGAITEARLVLALIMKRVSQHT